MNGNPLNTDTEGTIEHVHIKRVMVTIIKFISERFEPTSHFKSRLSLIVQVNAVLNRTVVVDSD